MKLESGAMSPALRGLATRASLASIEALGLEARGDRLSAAVRWVEAAATGRELARRLLNGSNFTGAGVEYAAAWEQALHAGDPRLAEAVEFEFRQQSAIYRALKPALAEASGRLRAPTRKSLERFTQIFGRLRNLRSPPATGRTSPSTTSENFWMNFRRYSNSAGFFSAN
jgi:hypothetical protein